MYKTVVLVMLGGGLGSLLRCLLGMGFNSLYPAIPPGTLMANLIAGYFIGILLALFSMYPAIASEWRLFLITGCLGGLSTFSTFSAEVANLVQQQKMFMVIAIVGVHVIGSVLLTLLGMFTVYAIRG